MWGPANLPTMRSVPSPLVWNRDRFAHTLTNPSIGQSQAYASRGGPAFWASTQRLCDLCGCCVQWKISLLNRYRNAKLSTSAVVHSRLSTRLAAIAVTLMFVVNGAVIGGFGGALPSLRDKLSLDATQIAIMLFCGGAAAILSMQIGGRLADAIGAREITLAAVPLLSLGMLTIGLAQVYPFAIVGSVLVGLGNGAMDVAMNAMGVQVEAARRRPIMSFFHAFWSVGNFIGAGAVLLLATMLGLKGGDIVTPLSISVAALTLVSLGILLKITPEAAVIHHTVDGVRTPIPAVAWVLGVMALAFGLCEGTALDWSSLHVTDVAGVDPTTGALGLIAVSAFMVVIRLLGDRLVARFGRRAVVRFGGLCAALGYLTVTLVSSLPLLVLGWALVGFGVGMIAPQVYALSGHIGGGRALAMVVTVGYAAFLIGPAFVGFLINQLGIHHAMAVPALLCVGIIALASTMPSSDVGLNQG
jgi:MFS family permease